MKKSIYFVALLIMISPAIFAQNVQKQDEENDGEGEGIEAPEAVEKSFMKEFPGINDVTWDAEDGDYEAEFKLNGTDASATYDKSGHKKELELEMNTAQLPVAVTTFLSSNYADYTITEAAKITNDKGAIMYEAEIGKAGKFYDALFDEAGAFISLTIGD